jgi:hypothetical protein
MVNRGNGKEKGMGRERKGEGQYEGEDDTKGEVQYVLNGTDNGCSTYEEGEAFWFMQGPELPSSTSCNDCCLLYLQIERERK